MVTIVKISNLDSVWGDALIMLHFKFEPSIPFWFEYRYFCVKLCQLNFTKQPVYLYGFCIANNIMVKNYFFSNFNFYLKLKVVIELHYFGAKKALYEDFWEFGSLALEHCMVWFN